jgi:hypothetical protein
VHAKNIQDYYTGLAEYAAGGGDISGISAPVQPYHGSSYRDKQAKAMAGYEAAQAAANDFKQGEYQRDAGGEGTTNTGGIIRDTVDPVDPDAPPQEFVPQPVGGSLAPTQTYTPHTGYTEDSEGVRTGTGGGAPIDMPTVTPIERIAARPDLRGESAQKFQQLAVSAPQKKVTSIADQMAQAKALRAGGSQDG